MEIDVKKGFELGCFKYQVKDGEAVTRDLRSRSRYGECSWQNQEIRVSDDFSKDQWHNTFLHELLEAINEVYCNGKINHDVLTNCANGLAQAIKSVDVIFVGGRDGNHRRDDKKKA